MRIPPVIVTAALALTLVSAATPVSAARWCVPSTGTPSIQSGLDAAQVGDTVQVAAGRYHERLVWPYRNGIALVGAGMDSTIVIADDFEVALYMVGSASAPALAVEHAPPPARLLAALGALAPQAVPLDSTTLVQGVRFRKGRDACVAVSGASPTIVACAMDSATAGPGLYCVNGSCARITACTLADNAGYGLSLTPGWRTTPVRHNLVARNRGGGVYSDGCPVLLAGNRITDNAGRGVYVVSTSTIADSNVVSGNTDCGVGASWGSIAMSRDTLSFNSGGANFWNCISASVQHSWITNNNGPGVILHSGAATFAFDTIDHNHDTGLTSQSTGLTVTNCTIASNTGYYGGGVTCYSYSAPCTITSNVFANNSALTGGGCLLNGPLAVTSNTFIGNTATTGAGLYWSDASGSAAGNVLAANHAISSGGGIELFGAAGGMTLRDNLITRNTAHDGGGLQASNASGSIFEHNLFAQDSAQGNGGAVNIASSFDVAVNQNTLVQNVAAGLGDALYTSGSVPAFWHCTFEDNGLGVYNADLVNIPNVQSNWWGAASGPWYRGANPGGLGDSLSTYASNFDPWLASPDTVAPPVPPRGLTLVKAPGVPLRLAWNRVPLADLSHYRVYVGHGAPGTGFDSWFDAADTSAALVNVAPDSTLRCAVTTWDRGGEESWFSRELAAGTAQLAAVTEAPGAGDVRLAPAMPNPFTTATTIAYALRSAARARLEVFDALGRRVALLADGLMAPGEHRSTWEGRETSGRAVRPGVYLVRLQTASGTRSLRIVRLD